MTGQPIVFLDTETTSLQPNRRVWEVGMIRRDDQGDRERRFFIRNVDLSDANAFALQVGGFYERHPQYAGGFDREPKAAARPTGLLSSKTLLERHEAAVEVERWTLGATIVGCNPTFDTEVLSSLLRLAALNWQPWHYHLIDMPALAAGWLLARGIDVGPLPWKSEHLAELCGVEPAAAEDRHTALGDARWVRSWWDTIQASALAEQSFLANLTEAVRAAGDDELDASMQSAKDAHPATQQPHIATVTPLTVRPHIEGAGR